jgi:hypothetical protein
MPLLYEDIPFREGYADSENVSVAPYPPISSKIIIIIGAIGTAAVIIGIIAVSAKKKPEGTHK